MTTVCFEPYSFFTLYLLLFLKFVFEVKLETRTTRKQPDTNVSSNTIGSNCVSSERLPVWRCDLKLVKPTWLLLCLTLIQGFQLFIVLFSPFFLGLILHILLRLYSHRHPCPPPKHARPGHFWTCAQCHADRKGHAPLKQWKDSSTMVIQQGHTRSKVRHT